ncbi:DUF5313 family protein [Pseudonocardia sp. GCM10023141]|uniref:DUF5313 family protein n=1 Tax=Pseudonocardia sp. GCM10023141 TaxID=3252653 RepID=UPI003607A300
MKGPGPLRWWWYAMGGGLPVRYREWVLHDITTRWWRWRSLLRSLVQILPVGVLIYLFLPTEPWVRLLAVAGGIWVGMVYALAYLDEVSEHRALKAGYPRGAAQAVRDQANAVKREAADARYAQRYRGGPPATPPGS